MEDNEKPKPMGQVIQIDEARIRDHLDEIVCGSLVPSGKVRDVARMLKAIHAQEDRKAAAEKI